MIDWLGHGVVYPWWLLLLPLVLIEIFFRRHQYALQKAHTHVEPRYVAFHERLTQMRSQVRFTLPTVFKALTYISIVLALAEITRGYVWTEEKLETPNVLLLVDSSGSMFQGRDSYASTGAKPITCLSVEEMIQYPRMKGMCRALKKFADMSEEIAHSSHQKKKPLVSLMIFARDPAIVLFPTTDYGRLQDQIEHFEWSADLLGGDTNIHIAFYAALVNLIFRYAPETDTPRVFTEEEIKLLRKSLRPQSGHFIPPPELNRKIINISPRIQEWTILILTDAVYDDLKSFETFDPSFWKLLEFAAYLRLPVYFISTENFLAQLKLAAQKTGGDFFLARRDDPLVNIEQIVKEIFEKHLQRTTTVQIQKHESYSWGCTLAGLIFFLSWLTAEYTFARSLTGDI